MVAIFLFHARAILIGYNNYMYSDLGITINLVETIIFSNEDASSFVYVQQRIEEAEAIWFVGGDKWNCLIV